MSKDAMKLMVGYTNLTKADRIEVIEKINEYERANSSQKEVLRENIEKIAGVVLGPTSSGRCPCCGR